MFPLVGLVGGKPDTDLVFSGAMQGMFVVYVTQRVPLAGVEPQLRLSRLLGAHRWCHRLPHERATREESPGYLWYDTVAWTACPTARAAP
jgi:hypothetical protein